MMHLGKKVVDATTPLLVEVSNDDIKCSTRNSELECAIAQGLRRKDGIISVRVGVRTVLVETQKQWTRYFLSGDDQKRTKLFDMVGYFEPDTYMLEPPPKKHKLGYRNGTKSGSNKREGKEQTVFNAPARRHAMKTK